MSDRKEKKKYEWKRKERDNAIPFAPACVVFECVAPEEPFGNVDYLIEPEPLDVYVLVCLTLQKVVRIYIYIYIFIHTYI